MTDGLRIGWTRAQAATWRTKYRRVLGCNLLLQAAIGIVALIAPTWLSQLVGLPAPLPSGWVRMWGMVLLIAALLYLPGWIDPIRARWSNFVGIAARVGMTLLCLLLGGGFWWFAAFEGVFVVLLTIYYGRLLRAELMSRP